MVRPKRYYFFHGCCLKFIKNLNSGRFIFRLCIVQYIPGIYHIYSYISYWPTYVFFSRADMVVKLTHEQLRIVNHNVQPGEVIKIIAFAGQSLNFTNFLNVNLTKKKRNNHFKVCFTWSLPYYRNICYCTFPLDYCMSQSSLKRPWRLRWIFQHHENILLSV